MSTDTERTAVVNGREPTPTSRSLLDKWKLINRINASHNLTATAKVVAVNLMWRMNCRWESCFPKQTTIVRDTGLSERGVRNALLELRDDGWITWTRESTRSVHVYRFCWDRPARHGDGPQLDDEPQDAADFADKRPEQSANRADDKPAKTADPNNGKGLTQEGHSLSTASPTKESRPAREKPSSSADAKKASAPPQEGSAQWQKDELWLRLGPQFKEAFYPSMSQAAFKQRLGKVCNRENWDLRKVLAALRATLDAGPGGDAFEYLTGVLRRPSPSTEEPRLRGPI